MEFKDIVHNDIETVGSSEPKFHVTNKIKRQAVKINEVRASRHSYRDKRVITKELLMGETDAVAIFAHENIPAHFKNKNAIEYFLYVNEERIQVVPVNSNKPGIKIIKTSTFNPENPTIKIVEDKIKSVVLEIYLRVEDRETTPMVGNIKLLTGKKEELS